MRSGRFKALISLVTAMIDAGFPGHDAPYPFLSNGRLIFWQEFTPADIVALVEAIYGREWAKHVAAAPALKLH